MATVVGKESFDSRKLLQVADADGWFGGFSNLLRKELGQWWGTRTWWLQTLIWIAMLNGISTVVMLVESSSAPDVLLIEVVQTFLSMSVGVIGIGTVIAAQGAIVGEKELGTAAWVMSKPASRYAFILAKIVSHTIGFWLAAILVPSIIFMITVSQLVAAPLSLPHFLAGMGVVALAQLFYLTLTLMLGTLFSSRGPITAIGVAFVLTGLLLKGMIPLPIMMVTPWLLTDLSPALALQMALPVNWLVPVLAVMGWIVLFTAVALWRFDREEF